MEEVEGIGWMLDFEVIMGAGGVGLYLRECLGEQGVCVEMKIRGMCGRDCDRK